MSQQQFRIPTLLALVLVAALSIGGLFAYEHASSFLGSARTSPVVQPTNIHITNVSDSSFVISWVTDEPIGAYVKYGTNPPTSVAYDIRDTDSIPKPYRTHYVRVSDVSPESTVTVAISHVDALFSLESVQLGPAITNPPQVLPVYGEYMTSSGTPSRGAIIYVTINGEVEWSTFISDTSSWIIPLASIRTNDLRGYYCSVRTCDDSTTIALQVVSEEGDSETTLTLRNARPVTAATTTPTQLVQGTQATPTAKPSPTITMTPTKAPSTPTPTKSQATGKVSILTPKEKSTLRFPKPLIRGEGVPGATIDIVLESAIKQVESVVVQEDGTWLWTPKVSLDPGPHTLTITTTDGSGKKVTLTRSFSVFKSGEQVLAAGTPSASLVPTRSVFPTSTPILPTATPLPEMPTSASFAPSVLIILGGMILIVLGFAVI